LNFVESIPNYISKKLDTDFFTGSMPENKKIIQAELDGFNSNLHAIATEEKRVISEWEETNSKIIKIFCLIGIEKFLLSSSC